MRNQKNSLRLHESEWAWSGPKLRQRFEPLNPGVGMAIAGNGRGSLDEENDGGDGEEENESEEEFLAKRKPWSGVSRHS